jgi:glycosyltransferase involved in cell wall biosynthesis
MRWFYGQMDRVACPSTATARELRAHGFDADRLVVVGRGVDTRAFSPEHRDEATRRAWYPDRPIKLLYVGRVSEEKNLACLARGFRLLAQGRNDVCLVVVGDGPLRSRLQREVADLPVAFPGVLRGRDLARAYASSDLFVFPSETDTFGVVVIEAQASGLPVVVSGKGGPRDALRDGLTGSVVTPMNPASLAAAVNDLLARPDRLTAMRAAARAHAQTLTPEASFEAFWDLHRDGLARSVAREAGTRVTESV